MPKELNRRSFLKGALAAAGAAVASGAPLPQAVKAASDKELATLLDLSKCIGCEECVMACQEVNDDYKRDPVKPIPKMFPPRVPTEDWSDRKDVTDRLTPYNWLFVQHLEVEVDGELQEINIPRRCMHCQNPPCADLCPWGAAYKQENGISILNPDLCLGGAKCKQVCPWDVPQRQSGVGLYLDVLPSLAGNGVMFKCNRCYERIDQGELPACIEVCPEGVQTIGPRDEILAKAHALAKEMNGYIYGEHENGGTNTIYVSPIPFELIDQTIKKEQKQSFDEEYQAVLKKKGDSVDPARLKKMTAKKVKDGRPGMGPVANSMASAENLTAALFIAPVAGAAAAIGKFRNALKKKPSDRSSSREVKSDE